MRKYLAIAFLTVLVAVVTWIFFSLRAERAGSGDAWKCIPEGSDCVVAITDWSAAMRHAAWISGVGTNGLAVQGVAPLSALPGAMALLDSLFQHQEGWHAVLSNGPCLIVFPNSHSPEDWAIVAGLHAPLAGSPQELIAAFGNGSTRSFQETTVTETASGWKLAVAGDCIIVSRSSSTAEAAILAAQGEQQWQGDAAWTEVRRTSSADMPLHFYIALEQGGWAQLDLMSGDRHHWLAGYAVPDSASRMLLVSEGPAPVIAGSLSPNTVVLDVFSHADASEGWRLAERSFEGTDAQRFWGRAWQDLGDSCQCDLNEAMLSWRSGEWGSAIIAAGDSLVPVLFFGVQEGVDAMARLAPVLGGEGSGVRPIRFPMAFERNSTSPFRVEAGFAMQAGRFVFVAATMEDLLRCVSFDPLRSLATRADYRAVAEVANPAGGEWSWQSEHGVTPVDAAVYRLFGGGSVLAAHILPAGERRALVRLYPPDPGGAEGAAPVAQAPADGSARWMLALDADITRRPWVVTNHTTQAKEILVQDAAHQLCLVDLKGQLMWKKKLPGPVIGEVHQVDALRNGKLQYAFCTASAIHLVDRKGNDVSGFPLALPATCTSGLVVFDYDRDRNYRLLAGCENGQVVNYGVDGKPTAGWKYSSAGWAPTWLAHVRTGSDDHLLVLDKSGNGAVLQRNGLARAGKRLKTAASADGSYTLVPGLALEDTRLMYVTADGSVVIQAVGDAAPAPVLTGLTSSARVGFADVNGDRKEDILAADGSSLRIIDHRGNAIATITTDYPMTSVPAAYRFSSTDWKIGVVTGGNFRLYKTDGTAENGSWPSDQSCILLDPDDNGHWDKVAILRNQLILY